MTLPTFLWSLTLSFLSLHLQLHPAAAGGSYAPTTGACPDLSSQPLVRTFSSQQSTNPQEQAYIHAVETNTIPDAWRAWLGDASDIQYNFSAFPTGTFPRIGIGVGGGGYRGALYGAGVLSALDGRNSSAKKSGTGGLLQVASYIAGSSGGSWVTVSMLLNNWPTTPELVYGIGNGLDGWMLDQDLFSPSDDDSQNQQYYQAVVNSVKQKAATGLPTSIVDPWGRVLAYHFLNGTKSNNMYDNSAHGAGQLWSAIPQINAFEQHTVPFPLLVSDSLHENQNVSGVLPLGNIVYEFSPYEFGSWDPGLAAMVNVTYVGTNLSDGFPADGKCTTGFDQASFVMGTSANIFSGILEGGSVDGFSSSDQEALLTELDHPSNSPNNAAANWPNPFQGINSSTFSESNSSWLGLVDGAANGEHVPLGSLLVNSRFVDVIVALDAGADTTDDWPNGTSLLQSSSRVKNVLSSSHQQLPPIPSSAADFIKYGLNVRPTFFGCDPEQNPPESPLIIYLPNSPPLDGSQPYTNPGSDTFDYPDDLTADFMNQAYANAIGGFLPNKTGADPNWDLCLKCAAIDRVRYKAAPSATSSSTTSSASPTQGLLSSSSSSSAPISQFTITVSSATSQVFLTSTSTFVSPSLSESSIDQEFSAVPSATTFVSQDAEPTFSLSQTALSDRFAGSRRAQATSTIQRSEVCQRCFQQYCYYPSAPPPPSSVPGRQYGFQDPLGGISQIEWWAKTHKAELAGIVLGVVAFVAGAIVGIILWRKRREKKQQYYRVDEFDLSDEPWKHYERNGEQYELLID